MSLSAGFDLKGKGVGLDGKAEATFGSSIEHSWSDTVRIDNSTTITMPPGRKGSVTAGTEYHRLSGRIRLNYDTRVNGHYIWYANYIEAKVPTGYKETGLEEKACGEKLMNGR